MQRITWNGIALHGGPLPGYAASHGCVRMPYDIAEKLFDKTWIGMRVIISPNDAAPVEISHPALFVPNAEAVAAAPARAETLAREAAALCIKPDKLRVEVGLAQRSPVEHAVGRKIMDKCRPRKFFDEIRRNRARADKPIGFWILTGKTSCNSFVEIDVANNSPVSYFGFGHRSGSEELHQPH